LLENRDPVVQSLADRLMLARRGPLGQEPQVWELFPDGEPGLPALSPDHPLSLKRYTLPPGQSTTFPLTAAGVQ
jgi:hypothetical protein